MAPVRFYDSRYRPCSKQLLIDFLCILWYISRLLNASIFRREKLRNRNNELITFLVKARQSGPWPFRGIHDGENFEIWKALLSKQPTFVVGDRITIIHERSLYRLPSTLKVSMTRDSELGWQYGFGPEIGKMVENKIKDEDYTTSSNVFLPFGHPCMFVTKQSKRRIHREATLQAPRYRVTYGQIEQLWEEGLLAANPLTILAEDLRKAVSVALNNHRVERQLRARSRMPRGFAPKMIISLRFDKDLRINNQSVDISFSWYGGPFCELEGVDLTGPTLKADLIKRLCD
jgi:hypothetical protein